MLAFVMLGSYWASDAFATCAKVYGGDGKLLGCALVEPYPPTISSCSCSTATVSVKTNLDHHEVLVQTGTISSNLGVIRSLDSGNWEVHPGQAGVKNFTATFKMTNQTCSGTYSGPTGSPHPTSSDLGQGACDYTENWEAPVVTCIGDSNLGHGNDCFGIDPDNGGNGGPAGGGKQKKNATFRVNQKCGPSPNSTPERPLSLMTYTIFSEGEIPDEGRGVGNTAWRADNTLDPPAQFTNATKAGADRGDVKLQHGGFPTYLSSSGQLLVDPVRSAQLYPADTVSGVAFAEGQVFYLQQEWLGTCASATLPPTTDQSILTPCSSNPSMDGCAGYTFFDWPRVLQSLTRVCTSDLGGGATTSPGPTWTSNAGPQDAGLQFGQGFFGDGFDNQGPENNNIDRTCPIHVTASGDVHVSSAAASAITGRTEPMTALPPSSETQLTCGGNKDSGVAWSTICGGPGLNVTTDIQTFKVKGKDILRVALESPDGITAGQLPHDSQFVDDPACGADELGNADAYKDAVVKHYTCTVDGTGLAEIAAAKAVAGQCTHNPIENHDKCPVGIQAEKVTSGSVPVRAQDIMQVGVTLGGF